MSGPPPAAGGAPPQMQYIPEPFERPYYLGLFNVADVQKQGQIGGAEAVQFLSRSKLPVETLKHIWTLCDQPQTNYLDHKKFAVAVRFIQCMQNGTRAQGARLESPPSSSLRPAMFEGVSGTVVPLPPEEASGGGAPAEGKPPMAPTTPQRPPQPNMRGPSPGPAMMRGASPVPPGAATPQRAPSPTPSITPSVHSQPPSTQAPPAATSNALTVQDPYGMSPADMARYQDICKEHAKPDGFVYGAEAVALFSKSGMPQNMLASIWNMVDVPVDNRLDPVEFGMAMHLIVCVSKKGMPMPPSLPASLAQLKQPQQPAGGMAAAPTAIPEPAAMTATPVPEQQPPVEQMPPSQPSQSDSVPPQQQQQEPPAIQTSGSGGGMSITDAFEGLDGSGPPPSYGAEEPAPAAAADAVIPPPQPAPQQPPPPQMSDAAAVPTPQMEQPTPVAVPPQAQQPAPVAVQPTVGLSMSVPVGGGVSAVPENGGIPAPATAAPTAADGAASEELAQARELLQKLQAENISLKARLSHFSEEEVEAQKELALTVSEITRLNSVLTGLRSDVLTAKGRLSDLTAAVKASKDNVSMLNGLVQEETATKNALEEANQSLEATLAAPGAAAVAPAAYAAPQPVTAPVANDDVFGFSAAAQPTPSQSGEELSQGSGPVPLSEPQSAPQVESQPSSEMMAVPAAPPAPPAEPQPAMGAYGAAVPVVAAPEPAPAQSAGHNRNMSTASAFGFGDDAAILGSGPTPFPPEQPVPPTPPTPPKQQPVAPAAPPTPVADPNALAEMRRKAKEADDLARDAEQASRVQMDRVGQLRQEAEMAQAQAQRRQAEAENKKKKKGMFGGGNKKKDTKEVEQLALDAKQKQDALLQAQGQANDAQALAMETRREADRLRKEAEDAELAAASSASLQHSQPAPAAEQPMYAQQTAPQTYAYVQQQHAQQPISPPQPQNVTSVTNGGAPVGAYQIPSGGDAYDNPFSS